MRAEGGRGKAFFNGAEKILESGRIFCGTEGVSGREGVVFDESERGYWPRAFSSACSRTFSARVRTGADLPVTWAPATCVCAIKALMRFSRRTVASVPKDGESAKLRGAKE